MELEQEIEHAQRVFDEFLRRRRMRRTTERNEVLEMAYRLDGHYSAEDLNNALNKNLPISRATIYNTLDLLVECGLVVKHQFAGQSIVYEKVTSSATHHHRICIQCGAVSEFSDQKIQRAIKNRHFNAFETLHYSLYLYGICKKCAARNKKRLR